MDSTEIIEKVRAEVERRKKELEKDKTIHPANQAGRIKELDLILSHLSDLEKEEKPKRVRTLEKEFDGYNSIVVTLDKYVLEGIGVHRGNKVIIKIQRKED